MAVERNLARIANFFDEVWNWGNLAVVDQNVADDFSYHDPANPWVAPGPPGVTDLVLTYRTAFPDLRFVLEDVIAEGDKVVVRWRAEGTHEGNLRHIPATGTRVSTTGITIFCLVGGKIAEAWTNYDMLGLLSELGVVSTPEEPSPEGFEPCGR
ncbi:MAG TPA: ester cyclase [Chloroflexi bacterium]|nr:ester cyclase [Chloroflexota bacterium]